MLCPLHCPVFKWQSCDFANLRIPDISAITAFFSLVSDSDCTTLAVYTAQLVFLNRNILESFYLVFLHIALIKWTLKNSTFLTAPLSDDSPSAFSLVRAATNSSFLASEVRFSTSSSCKEDICQLRSATGFYTVAIHIDRYRGELNTLLVWYSNGQLPDSRMFENSNTI